MFQALEDKGTRFLRGQLVLISAGPGTGKSAFVLTLALRARVPTLYFSADSDAFTQATRSVSILTGWPLEKAAQAVRGDQLGDAASVFRGIPIRFNYEASPNLDNIENTIRAYEEVYGTFPELIVIDNVTNVRSGGDGDDDPFSGLESLMDYLHDMGRQTGACVIGLHHVTGSYNDADKAIPLSGVKGQITRVPEMVLTLHRRISDADYGVDTLYVSTVKNRGGKSDPSGADAAELEFVGDSMQIRDFLYPIT
ncbi:DnaB-like helicase C-terminal domain-containing protein [Nocardia terpenica]|uniref:DnaB-like helicase C-terminal domain-containing protein n=1 Tax=Nocardia terpenica TaxID=455432 RepID=UPI0003168127|nr:DnaB-like helicase C-terminal domain-containing protein [Nocardia terpenica]